MFKISYITTHISVCCLNNYYNTSVFAVVALFISNDVLEMSTIMEISIQGNGKIWNKIYVFYYWNAFPP